MSTPEPLSSDDDIKAVYAALRKVEVAMKSVPSDSYLFRDLHDVWKILNDLTKRANLRALTPNTESR